MATNSAETLTIPIGSAITPNHERMVYTPATRA